MENIILNFKGGQITVSFNNQEELIWMKQNEPTFGRILDENKISEVLNIHKENIDDRFPIQEVSTGLPVIVVPLKSLDAVKKVKVNRENILS